MSEKKLSTRILVALINTLKRIIFSLLCLAIFLVLGQEYLILPSMMANVPKTPPPKEFQQLTVTNRSGKKINVWHIPLEAEKRKGVILLSHGNGELVQHSAWIQEDFHMLGYSTYAYDYPHTGGSEGWPWQSSLQENGEALIEFIKTRENVSADDIIPVGVSFGTGVSTYLAQKYNTKKLILFAPYTSISDVVKGHSLYWPLSPFVRLDLPSKDYISKLTNTCVIDAHGETDGTIPVSHSHELEKFYKGQSHFYKIIISESGHNDLIPYAWDEVVRSISRCEKSN